MHKKTNILFFIPKLNSGGAERVTINILRYIDETLFDISLVVIEKGGEYYDLIPSFVKIYDLKSSKTILSILKLRKLISHIKPDVVFSTLIRSHIALDQALVGIGKKPYIILRSPTSPKLLLSHKKLSFVKRLLLQKAYSNADLILAQTPEMKNELMQYHNVDEDKIKVFINIIDTDFIDKQIKDIENPFDHLKINVVAAGRLSYEKGFDILIKSFKKVVNQNSSFFLHILGNDNGEKENLQNMIKQFDLEKNIKFWGHQDNPYKFFLFADMFVLSSRREGLPNAVLENLYLKKPVIATKCIPFMNQLIKDGENGFLVEVENVKELAYAMLDYKKMDIDNIKFIQNNSSVNELFLVNKDR